MKALITLSLALLLTGSIASGQERRYDYSGSTILKITPFFLTDAELGFGLSAEYRAHRYLSVQMGIDYLTPVQQEGARSGSGFRLRPEGRIYIPHRRSRRTMRHFDAYIGLELTLKYIKTDFAEWKIKEDSYGNTYNQYLVYGSTNLAFGPIFKTGLQWYPGPARRLVFDAVIGFGPVFNNINLQSKGYPLPDTRRTYHNDDFSYNKYTGTSAYMNLDFRIGYRF